MEYLIGRDRTIILDDIRLLSIAKIQDISHYHFDSGIEEYNDFLKFAYHFWILNISKTFLLLHNSTNELLAYMTLSADSIKLTHEEKEFHDLSRVPYASIPALKVGKLAVNKKLSDTARQKGYGSFMLQMARAYAFDMNEMGVACRFLTVDADIEYNSSTPQFYIKNGFVENLNNKRRNPKHTISMRKDIFDDI